MQMLFGNIITTPTSVFSIDGEYRETFQTSLPTTISELMNQVTETGIYQMWSPKGNERINVFVHVEDDGKKWLLILRYNHLGGTNPDLRQIDHGDFPIPLKTDDLLTYNDERETASWGHVSNEYLSIFKVSEVAFFGITSAHDRVVNFKSSSDGPLAYISGSRLSFNSGRCFCTEPYNLFSKKETASIPRLANKFLTSSVSLTSSPFYIENVAYWNIKSDGYRWEVDNYLAPTHKMPYSVVIQETTKTDAVRTMKESYKQGYQFNTLHMVFVR